MVRRWSLGLATAIALLLAWWAVTPSAPLPTDAPAAMFSAGRAMRDVREIGREPHVAGSAANRRVTLALVHELAGMGLAVGLQPVPLDAKARAKLAQQSGRPVPAALSGQSVVALLPGRDRSGPAVLLMAHHDTVWGSPGAADDTVGVAAILEVVRALRTGPPPARDVIVLFTDGEELGLNGARAFFDADALRAHVGVVLNLEARGAGGRALMFETGRGNGAMMRLFGHTVPWPSATSLSVLVYRLLPNSTDLTAALKHDVFGFNFAIAGRAGLYHSPLATPERLDPASLQDMGQQALALTRALAGAAALPARAPDLAFADLWGSRLVAYPAWVGWLLLGTSVVIAGAATLRLRRRGGEIGREALRGLIVPAVLCLGTPLLLFVVNRLSGAGPGANYYDRLAALPRLETQAALLCLAVLLAIARWRRPGLWGGWLALFLVLGLAGLAVQIAAPTAAPLLHWPLLLAAVQMGIAAWLDPALERPHAIAPVALLAAAGAGQVLAFGHLLFLMLGAGTPEAAIVVLLPVALLGWPLLHRALPARVTSVAATLALVAALGLALWVRLDPIAPSTAVYSVDKR